MVRTGNPIGPGWSGLVVPAEMLRTYETVPDGASLPAAILRAEGSRAYESDGNRAWDRLAGAWRDLATLGALYQATGGLNTLMGLVQVAGFPGNLIAIATEYDQGGLDIYTQYVRSGKVLAGIVTPAAVWFDGFGVVLTSGSGVPLGDRVTAGSGSIGISQTRATSALLSSGATGGSYAVLNPAAIGAWIPANFLASRFYVAARIWLETAVDANSVLGFRVHDSVGGNAIVLGAIGGVSTANFSLQSGAATLDTGIPLAAGSHVLEFYRADGNIYARIDGAAAGNLAMPGAFVGRAYCNIIASNGATAANRALAADWYMGISEANL
jgi:hypothetical protein